MEANISVESYKDKSKLDSKVKISLLDSDKKKVNSVKSTYEINGQGNISLDLPKDLEEGTYYLKVNAKSSKGNDTLTRPITLTNEDTENVTISVDKGIYKPGDTINYRILTTYKTGDTPIEQELGINIYDGNGNKVYFQKSKTSSYGITSGNFTLADEVNSGTYNIEVETSSKKYSKTFTVNPYVTPQFQSQIITDKEYYKPKETASITVDTKYFFGEPVKNAKVTLNLNNTVQEGLTNDEGKFNFEYTFDEKTSKLSIESTVIDESNYLVESKKEVFCSEEPFQIEVLPEYGNIIQNIDNNIYFFTKNIDGTALKTYLTVKIGNKLSRQVITDENGVGVLSLSKSDLAKFPITTYSAYSNSTMTSNLAFNISAKSMQGNELTKTENLNLKTNTGILLSTDKVKYNVQEDIKITLNSANDLKETTLAICKNNEVVKFITTTSNECIVNLEDTYGIIDIYVLGNTKITTTPNSVIQSKRTIFIKPNKELNIDLKLDKTEYQPKDNLNLNVDLTDENNKSVDGALLVSILDESVLDLADNDLSIDNIKLALSDIKVSNELDAATLYTNIIDDKSESTLMAILLKQDTNNVNIKKYSENSNTEKEDAITRLEIVGGLTLIVVAIVLAIRYENVRNFIKTLLSILMTFILISIGILDDIDLPKIIVGIIIAVVLYIALLHKCKDSIFRLFLGYIESLIMISLTIGIFDNFDAGWGWLTIICELLILFMIARISFKFEIKNVKPELMRKIEQIPLDIIICTIILFFTFIGSNWGSIVAVIIFIILNIIYGFITKPDSTEEKEEQKITITFNKSIIISIVAIAVLILISWIIMHIYENRKGTISNSSNYYYEDVRPYKEGGMVQPSDLQATYEDASSSDSGSLFESALDSAKDLFSSKNNKSETKQESQDIATNDLEDDDDMMETSILVDNQVEKTEEENIRNIFLESLCFIPELVTNNGKVSTDIAISDNITTWKIQVVGNTKEGNIGYATTNFTVKKDFFVDFTLPNNCIVGDDINIPVTIYNYTEKELTITLNVKEETWCTLGKFADQITVSPNSTKMIYVPITIIKSGNHSLKIKASTDGAQDIVQKDINIQDKGLKITNVVSSGSVEKEMNQDIIYDANALEGTKKIKIKLYPSMISQVVEGLESIFKMPTGCFEQTASGLYPDIVVLKYMEDNNIINDELKQQALYYISSGYQKTLTYEVKTEKGGYSLYGKSPANPILTAYGLMELKDASTVYSVDENVINNMKDYLYKKQSTNGNFDLGNSYSSVVSSSNSLTLNAYVIWALSEADAKDSRLNKSISYIENNLDNMNDSYTLALAANIFINVGNTEKAKLVINKLVEQIETTDKGSYIKSSITDYYGTRGSTQNVQATALTSMALSKFDSKNYEKTNKNLINYIISAKDANGNWRTTQATILALKALIGYQSKSDLSNQTITINVNGKTEELKIEDSSLDIYEYNFDNTETENNIKIKMEKGEIYYEIIEEYYQEYEEAQKQAQTKIDVKTFIKNEVKLNEVVSQDITLKNISGQEIINGMVEISIPQGFRVQEESLSILVKDGLIEKYEYNYTKVYLYLQNFKVNKELQLSINYRPTYPGKITGGGVRCYDYYNPEIEGISTPMLINIIQ